MEKESYIVDGCGTVVTYNWMLKRARIALDEAKRSDEGRMFNCMDTIVYSAFAMEAFINHIGSHLHDDWAKTERKKSKYDKLKNLKSELGITTDKYEEPYKSINDSFHYRNILAHGKTETITETDKILSLTEEEAKSHSIENEWMKLSTLENAEKIFSDTVKVITEMYLSAGLGKFPFLQFYSGSHSLKKAK